MRIREKFRTDYNLAIMNVVSDETNMSYNLINVILLLVGMSSAIFLLWKKQKKMPKLTCVVQLLVGLGWMTAGVLSILDKYSSSGFVVRILLFLLYGVFIIIGMGMVVFSVWSFTDEWRKDSSPHTSNEALPHESSQAKGYTNCND